MPVFACSIGCGPPSIRSGRVAALFLRSGQLIRVLESRLTAVQGLFLFYHGRRRVPTALRAFIDMVRAQKSISGRRSLKSTFESSAAFSEPQPIPPARGAAKPEEVLLNVPQQRIQRRSI